MKKHDLKKMALMGLTGGLLISQQQPLQAVAKSGEFQETPWETFQHDCGSKCKSILPQSGCSSCRSLRATNPSGCGGRNSCGGMIAEGDSQSQGLQNPETKKDPNYGNMNYHLLTEQELMLELNEEGKRMYNSLDDQGKALARRVASMRCNGTNECAGLNACMTEKNSCAGKGTCKGQGKCAMSDKNLAVKLVYNKMAAKRAKLGN